MPDDNKQDFKKGMSNSFVWFLMAAFLFALMVQLSGKIVFFLDEQAANGRGKYERIYFYFFNRDFASKLLGDLFDCDVTDNRRQNQEAKNCIADQNPENPKREFAFVHRFSSDVVSSCGAIVAVRSILPNYARQ